MQQSVDDSYIQALCNEIKFYKDKYSINKWKSIYIGGGTPSLLKINQLQTLFSEILKNCEPNIQEITIEVNPDDISAEYLIELSKTPVTRLSCGIQSLKNECLNFVNRRADTKINKNAIELINKYWPKGKSFDLICGLPLENENSFFNGLDYILKTNPDHISMYSLSVEEETELGKLIFSNKVEYDFDKADELWLKSKSYLIEHGFNQYEISNFAKSGKESVHNMVYWNHGNYIGCGSGAAGTVYNNDGAAIRWSNLKDINKYICFWNQNEVEINDSLIPAEKEIIDVDTSVYEFFMMGLRKSCGISNVQFNNCFNKELPENFMKVFNRWKETKLADIYEKEGEQFYFLTEKGRDYLNRFLEELDI